MSIINLNVTLSNMELTTSLFKKDDLFINLYMALSPDVIIYSHSIEQYIGTIKWGLRFALSW